MSQEHFSPVFPESPSSPVIVARVETPAQTITHPLDHPDAIRFHYVEVTPQLAEQWLERNVLNRNVRKAEVSQLAKTMELGAWRLTAETLKFDGQGALLDGQHRLLAVVESGVTVPFHVCDGLASDVKRHLDTGAKRSFGDVLKMDGEAHSALLSNAAAWVYRYTLQQIGLHRLSHEECDQTIAQHPGIREFLPYASQVKGLLPGGLSVAWYYLCSRTHRDRATVFFTGLATGATIETSPVYVLRERIIKDRVRGKSRMLNDLTIAAFIIKAWNAFTTEQPLTVLRWNKGEAFPLIED